MTTIDHPFFGPKDRSYLKPHLAIPAAYLDESMLFYKSLGAQVKRVYKTNVVMNLFDLQLVLHQSWDITKEPQMYPRHFGFILSKEAFLTMYDRFFDSKHLWKDRFKRYEGEPAEHETFFLVDPSNNLIEFKYYLHPEQI